jgi:ATP-dependent DNA helicase PIF1
MDKNFFAPRKRALPLQNSPARLTVDKNFFAPRKRALPIITESLKRKSSEQSPSPPPSPKRTERAQSFISISSGDEDDGPPLQRVVEPTLCDEQKELVELIKSGKSIFFTGSAGCGKSTALKVAVEALRDSGKRVEVTAPTGRAAIQVDGTTTWLFMGWHPDMLRKGVRQLKYATYASKQTRKRHHRTDVLVIDEISMVSSSFLDHVNVCLKHIRHSELPFGGIQVIVTGDFCQLPPVDPFQLCYHCGAVTKFDRSEDEYNCTNTRCKARFHHEDRWAFRSAVWEEAQFVHINLSEIHRQSDETFIKMLQKCRLGIPFTEDDIELLVNHESEVEDAARLASTKGEAETINRGRYNEIKQLERKYKVYDDWCWNGRRKDQDDFYGRRFPDGTLMAFKEHHFDEVVSLKETMLVMLQVNLDIRHGLVNGSQGIICGWEPIEAPDLPGLLGQDVELRESGMEIFTARHMDSNDDEQMHVWPRVRFTNGQVRTIYPWCFVSTVPGERNNRVDGRVEDSKLHRTQIPLIPGWAITIHKSQGMTLDRVIVNVARSFENGQVYVALSRATNLRGLKVEVATGLSVGEGGNEEVREFLKAKFGSEIFLEHEDPAAISA